MKKIPDFPWPTPSVHRDRMERVLSAMYAVLDKRRIRPKGRYVLSEELARAAVEAVDSVVDEPLCGDPFNPRGWFVYVLWGDQPRRAVYVGQSTNVLARLGKHMENRQKRDLTHRVEIIRCRDRWHMEQMEVRLIRLHRPLLNITRYGASA